MSFFGLYWLQRPNSNSLFCALIHKGFALSIWFGYYKQFLRTLKYYAVTNKPKSTRKYLLDGPPYFTNLPSFWPCFTALSSILTVTVYLHITKKDQVLIYFIRGHGIVTAKGQCFGTLITDMHVITQARCILKDTGKKWKVKPNLKKALVAHVIYFFWLFIGYL